MAWQALNQVLTENFGAVRPGLVIAAVTGVGIVLHLLTRLLRRWSDDG